MKGILLFLILTLSVQAAEPIAAGEWSAPVEGLRARLLLSEEKAVDGTRDGVIYLELQNVGDSGNPMVLLGFPRLQFQLCDEAGKPVGHSPIYANIASMDLSKVPIVLPHDSLIRLHMSVSGYALPIDGSLAIQLPSDFWAIAPGLRGKRLLSASYSVPLLDPADGAGELKDRHYLNGVGRVWRGTIEMPKLEIPLPK